MKSLSLHVIDTAFVAANVNNADEVTASSILED